MKKILLSIFVCIAAMSGYSQQVERAPYTLEEANQKIEVLEKRKAGLETRKGTILAGSPTQQEIERINKSIADTNTEIQRWVDVRTSIIAAEGKKKGSDSIESK